MAILIETVDEYNEHGFLIHAHNFTGAFVRGRTREEAMDKIGAEIAQYIMWTDSERMSVNETFEVKCIQKHQSDLQIHDADSEVIFESEKKPLNMEEYRRLKALVIKSAQDFNTLYQSIPDKNHSLLKDRRTFYGTIPHTAVEMYAHTNNVTNYYVGEIGARAENLPDILESRLHALQRVEKMPDYLSNPVCSGSYGEQWSLRKVLRRFIWHDRIHAKSMYRRAAGVWGKECIQNPYSFEL